MAKNKSSKPTRKEPEAKPEATEGASFLIRFPDPRIRQQIKKWAERERRSENMAVVMLLEKALAADDLWPPKD